MERNVVENAKKIVRETARKKEVKQKLLSSFLELSEEYGGETFTSAFWELVEEIIAEIRRKEDVN